MKQASKFSVCSAFPRCYGKQKKKKVVVAKVVILSWNSSVPEGIHTYTRSSSCLVLFLLFFPPLQKAPQIHTTSFECLLSKSLPAGSGPRLFSFKAVGSGLDVMLQGDNIMWSVHSSRPLSQYNLRRKLHTTLSAKRKCLTKQNCLLLLHSCLCISWKNSLYSEWGAVLSCWFRVLSSLYDCVHCWAIVSLIEMLL